MKIKDKPQALSVVLPPDLREELQQLADATERSLGAMIRVIAAEYVERVKNVPK